MEGCGGGSFLRCQEPFDQAAVLAFDTSQLRECGGQTEQPGISRVDAAHQRLYQPLKDLVAQPAGDETRNRFILITWRRRLLKILSQPGPAFGRDQRAIGESFEIGGDQPCQPFRQAVEGASIANVGLTPPLVWAIQPSCDSQLFTEADAPQLAGEKAIGGTLDDKTVDALGKDFAAKA
ncbi:MAG: hypothetical protein KatS3mg057_0344 [Herpetosiphonaceae bacterium]|nr:MAG: hypothetical protein KatS3mg057_0344 [Herpetosiphonaceae bacterium]